jgi:Zn-dependent metalloprotease
MKSKLYKIIVIAAISVSFYTYGQTKQSFIYNRPYEKTTDAKQTTMQNDVVSMMDTSRKVPAKPKIVVKNGSFYANVEKFQMTGEEMISQLNDLLKLSEHHSFIPQRKQSKGEENSQNIQPIVEKTDELGFLHANFQQIYKGIIVDGQIIMFHSKNGILKSINGHIAKFEDMDISVNISDEQALNIAKKHLNVTELANQYPVETVIAKIPNQKETLIRLTRKVRIESNAPIAVYHVYIDAQTGEVLNKISQIADADVQGTAHTLYNGVQTITCNRSGSIYQLVDNARNIKTYDATNWSTAPVINPVLFTNSSATWSGYPRLDTISITAIPSQGWWYSASDSSPDLYIKIKNKHDKVLDSLPRINNTSPPLTFKVNVYLNDPPYTVELWDYNSGKSHVKGGSFTISTVSTGTTSWSNSGNSGTYTVAMAVHPALDVHWGMEKTYDFYMNVFNRNSYDDEGGEIRNFVNAPKSIFSSMPNNAAAITGANPYMIYGMGDGSTMNPVMGLDVIGHEFSHIIVDNSIGGGLEYQGESGALNESFADIFGTCIEFYANVNPNWTIGENIMKGTTSYMRNMANPSTTALSFGNRQPDTYEGNYWADPLNSSNDNGGVHKNSGVQNHWFYLLCQGGNDTNDLGNTYAVTGIGMNDARSIAYRNLMYYLTPYSFHSDAYTGSLQAAEDLFGNPSQQYTSVKQAWYAVGVSGDTANNCDILTVLTDTSGTITDGSGSSDYTGNRRCEWLIAPAGATQIVLNFTSFATENGYDFVCVYNGPDTTRPLLAKLSGTTLPSTIRTTAGVGAMYVRFITDPYETDSGWTANYTSIGYTPSCDSITTLTAASGSFSNGSGSGNYGNNQYCVWAIAPPCAQTVTLSFSQFNTESTYDKVIVYDDWDMSNVLLTHSGTTIPSPVTSTTGKMLVVFHSDYSTVKQGFTANYTSTGTVQCSGLSLLDTSANGTFSDGSGTNNYCNNLDCQWLIQPPQASTITLTFTDFDLEDTASDGTVYDAVEVYDGLSTAAPLLGRFAGNAIPPAVTSTGSSMLLRFVTDMEVNKQGWTANYTSIAYTPSCDSITTLTAASGSFSDGSGSGKYGNNQHCIWAITPACVKTIRLSFSQFDIEEDDDSLVVYDDSDMLNVLGVYSGSTIPSPVTSTTGKMFVVFHSNASSVRQGFTADYTSSGDARCLGLSLLDTSANGTFSDGSGTNNYCNNLNCRWLIMPPQASTITLTFTDFDLEDTASDGTVYDAVEVYDGISIVSPLLGRFAGNAIPPAVTSTGGRMLVCFVTNTEVNKQGWTANYTSIAYTSSCDSITTLTAASGSFSDGSGSENYGNNRHCIWAITPPCAQTVTLSFSQFDIEEDDDSLIVYDDSDMLNVLGVYSGSIIPLPVTSTTGKMFVVFHSNASAVRQGFTANYTSTGNVQCSGVTLLNTSDNGTFSDGSGTNNYCNNLDCQWLIQPPQASTITLGFTDFDLEDTASDGRMYDAVEIYDGTTTAAPLLDRFTGNAIPPAITSTGGSMLVRFVTNTKVNKQGWTANYVSTQSPYCRGIVVLSTPSDTFSDGSENNLYANNTKCGWLIEPEKAANISLFFSSFATESNKDQVTVYDGADNRSPVLGQYSGTTLPPVVTSSGGSMYVVFSSNASVRGQGWSAHYTSIPKNSIHKTAFDENIRIYPNPTEGIFTVSSQYNHPFPAKIFDIVGKEIKELQIIKGNNKINVSHLNKGLYWIRFEIDDKIYYTAKLIVN